VSAKTFEAFCRPMIGHRSQDFKNLYAGLQPSLQELFYTKQPVYLSTSSAWGVMEAAIRNLVAKKVLVCMNGAFSDKWYDVAIKCGKAAEKCQVEWGQPITAAIVKEKLAQGGFDALTMIHNETSTGTMSPLAEICEVVRSFPDVCMIVDTVSSFSAVPIKMDEWGIDVLLTGSQKAMAMPPGLALFALSQKALDRAATVKDRGYYFDFLEFQKNGAESMTPSTPSIAHIYALKSKLEDIFAEGVENRYRRHDENNNIVREWVRSKGLELFPDEKFASKSLTCVKNNKNLDVAAMVKTLKQKHNFLIDGGYGKIRGTTFRLSNMGDETPATMRELLAALDDVLAG